MTQSSSVKKSSPLLIAAAWIIVIVPTAWGLKYTVQNAMNLMGVQSFYQYIARGSILLAAVIFDHWRRTRKT